MPLDGETAPSNGKKASLHTECTGNLPGRLMFLKEERFAVPTYEPCSLIVRPLSNSIIIFLYTDIANSICPQALLTNELVLSSIVCITLGWEVRW